MFIGVFAFSLFSPVVSAMETQATLYSISLCGAALAEQSYAQQLFCPDVSISTVYLSLSVCLSVCLSIYLSIDLSIYVYLSAKSSTSFGGETAWPISMKFGR